MTVQITHTENIRHYCYFSALMRKNKATLTTTIIAHNIGIKISGRKKKVINEM